MLLEAFWNLRTAEGPEPVLAAAVLLLSVGLVSLATAQVARRVLDS